MKSFFSKQFLNFFLIISVSFSTLGGVFYWQVYNYSVNQNQKDLEQGALSVVGFTLTFIDDPTSRSLYVYMSNLQAVGQFVGAHILVTDVNGQVIACSGGEEDGHIGLRVPTSCLPFDLPEGKYSAFGNMGGLYSERVFTVGIPVRTESGTYVGAVFASSDIAEMTGMLRDMRRFFLFGALCALTLAIILSWLSAKRLARPVRAMVTVARKVSRGDFNARVDMTGQDEFFELSKAFNQMVASLNEVERRRRDFLADISHDLKTPMTTISGFVDGILDGAIPRERQNEYLGVIKDETYRLSRIVSRLLYLARMEESGYSLSVSRVDICELARMVIIRLGGLADKRGIMIDAVFESEEIFVLCDRDATTQVLYNLLDNAVKFTNPGGEIKIKVFKKPGYACVGVFNTGIGITPEDAPYVFDRFYKSDRSRGVDREGSGLGLFICKSLINAQKGEITFFSIPGKSCEFTFTLPLA